MSRAHERYRRQTTDGRAIAYSERGREFTFAKNQRRKTDEKSESAIGKNEERATDLSAVDVSGAEVDDDVGDEHDIDEDIDDEERVKRHTVRDAGGGGGARSRPVRRRQTDAGRRLPARDALAEQEGGRVRREDGRVEDEQQRDPVPDGLDRRVVPDDAERHGAGRRQRTSAERCTDRLLVVV